MSRDLSLYEAMGGTYTEIDGILYPDIRIKEINPDEFMEEYGYRKKYFGVEEVRTKEKQKKTRWLRDCRVCQVKYLGL